MVRRIYPAREAVPAVAQRPLEDITETTSAEPEPNADAETDMSVEAQHFKRVIDEAFLRIGAILWDYLAVLRWFDVFGARNKIVLAAVRRRDAFLQRLIDAERQRLAEGGGDGESEKKKGMIAVLLTLHKTEPD
ncbi:hypothetical protein PR202_ga13559 [Eleusine coracana subsp. coracana]|uniref:Uncharacterized protein n=1 Tax=Eleusine coracana subsp. coracana TaxID=191504 RepID=A0AAV5CEB4_ELECO|nr:hypothetical protein PR202_ga13559 [Eleusine coracana subsp. coracana]